MATDADSIEAVWRTRLVLTTAAGSIAADMDNLRCLDHGWRGFHGYRFPTGWLGVYPCHP